MPASLSPEPFGSPVPTQIVFFDGSVGSIRSDPIALLGIPLAGSALSEICVQLGLVALPLLVFHTPPPAAPT